MARFKIVKHRFSYHVIGYSGVKKPTKGKKATYKEQLISSHLRIISGSLTRAEKAKKNYEAAKLELSNVPEHSLITRLWREMHLGLIIAIACGLLFEMGVKFLSGGH